MNKKKILMVLTRSPYPVTDGTRFKIMNNIITALSKDYTIDFVIVSNEFVSEEAKAFLKQYGTVDSFVFSKFGFVLRALWGFFSGKPFQVGAFYSHKVQQFIDTKVSRYDAIYFHTIRTSEYAIHCNRDLRNKSVMDYNDAISFHYSKAIPFVGVVKKIFYKIEGFLVSRYEKKIQPYFNYRVAISNRDIQMLRINEHDKWFKISYGSSAQETLNFNTQGLKSKIFFMGNLDYPPNRDGLNYFIQYVFPSIRLKIPNIELIVVGKGRVGLEREGVRYLGFVDSIQESIQDCFCMVAPIRFGAGTPTKIIDAMSLGVPVVSSPFSISGLDNFKHGTHGLVVDRDQNVEDWVYAVNELYENESLRMSMSHQAIIYSKEHYSNIQAQKKWLELFSQIIES